ncbi:hypothetical protein [Cupriavidus necator]
MPANGFGLACAWIDQRHATRGWGATLPPASMPRIDFRFTSLQALVQAHQAALAAR